jgi:4'-phosphopantetheinyl transferase EntD
VKILPALFGGDIVTEEIELFATPLAELLPEEAASMSRAASVRLLEFRGGRHCARHALARLGLPDTPVLRASDRSPVWPDGFVGSIAHTRNRHRGFCGAVVARATHVRSLGLDVELDEPLEPKLWPRVLTAREHSWLNQKPDSERGFWGKLVFSAKECAYKCQYPLSHQFLEFADVDVTFSETGNELFAVLGRCAGPFPSGAVFAGRYARQDGIVATGVTVLAH